MDEVCKGFQELMGLALLPVLCILRSWPKPVAVSLEGAAAAFCVGLGSPVGPYEVVGVSPSPQFLY